MKSTWCLCLCTAALIGCGDNEHVGADAPPAPSPDAAPDAAPPPPPGIVMLDYTYAVDVTTDGRTALFETVTDVATAVLYDTVAHTGREVAMVGDPSVDLATGLSDNLAISAEYGNPVESGVWSEGTGWVTYPATYTPGCDVFNGGVFDINRDATVTTGILWHGCATEAFRWSAGTVTPLQLLGTPGEGLSASNRGSVVSDDGSVIGGFAANGSADRTPAKWDATGAGVLLDPTNTENPGEVLAINADGTVLAGNLTNEGFVWTAAAGMTTLPRLADEDPQAMTFPNAMTADGTVIVGTVGDGFSLTPPTAVVWSHGQIKKLGDIVAAAGVTIPDGLALQNVLGINGDGTVLVGTAASDTMFKTFVLRLPAGAL